MVEREILTVLTIAARIIFWTRTFVSCQSLIASAIIKARLIGTLIDY